MPQNRIGDLLRENDVSRRRVAKEIGVHPTTVGRWESGISPIPDFRKQQLAELFGVSVPYLMGWENGNGDNGNGNGERAVA